MKNRIYTQLLLNIVRKSVGSQVIFRLMPEIDVRLYIEQM